MTAKESARTVPEKSSIRWLFIVLSAIGLATFIHGALSPHPERAWQAYLINFLLWSGIAQGAVVFSAVMHMTKSRWSGALAGLAEAFAGFFPLSFVLFLALLLGRAYVFPWMHHDLHGKEVWLNLPFLFTRNVIGLLILYGVGFIYLYYALQLKFDPNRPTSGMRGWIYRGWRRNGNNADLIKGRMTVWGGLYILAFVLVLCLIGFDLVMAADPHWISTLFGGYTFVKAFYTGLGALIILASVSHLRRGDASSLTDSQFIDIGKLFLAFCLLWADFFYVQLTVIWYGNIPEETHYVILRTMLSPWRALAWVVFILAFIIPFIVLINRKVKTKPVAMIALCSLAIIGVWLEHFLLLGPALSHGATDLPLGLYDILIFLGFLGLMVISVGRFMRTFPETTAGSLIQSA
jgi:Ni/Fe-hydrogenase subunit HybB-like protein